MKLTKKILNEHGIHNLYDLVKVLNSQICLYYVPATNERLNYNYAFWRYIRHTENGDKQKDFTVTCREQKQPVFEQAVKFIKGNFGIEITDKDPFGGYHPKGTLDKLRELIESENKESRNE